ncbi:MULTISPECIES: hypothetical protein [Enterococcus]|uniref:hypothetical protein n=1 Tax=Enterococcus TaxID=1350 RepID=UPI000889514C|nr:hypothetical protein [Enterococcus casseliflavus]SDK02482.1 hypothetical protein SAMN05216513_102326 [Enterococcus casseliflavus]
MDNFEIDLPNERILSINVTDYSLYRYDFNAFSLLPLQKLASQSINQNIREKVMSNKTLRADLFSSVSKISLVNKLSNQSEKEYVANLSDIAKEKLASGEWSLGVRKKTGETYAVIKDTLTGKNKSFLTIDKKVVKDLGILPELSAIQGQLASLSEQIEVLNRNIQRIEKGQYNDRFAGFFSARQLVIEGMASENESIKYELLLGAIKLSNETVGKLMYSIHEDVLALIDTKLKSRDAKRIDELLQNSLGYLNSCVQLNLIAYTVLTEQKSLYATLANYHSFIQQELIKENNDGRTVAWLLDNGHIGNDGRIVELSNNISNTIELIFESYNKDKIEVFENEKIDNKDL